MKKRLFASILALIVAAATVTAVFAATRMSTVPVQGNKLAVVISADTVTGGGTPAPAATCAQTNFFKPGQLVVFRMWATNVKDGGYAITPKNVASPPTVTIPGVKKPIQFAWASEPRNAPKVSYWETTWSVPATYPIGTVNFVIKVKTKKTAKYASISGKYTQAGFSPASDLQITT